MRFELVNDVGDVDGGVVVVCDAVGGTGRGGNVVGLAGVCDPGVVGGKPIRRGSEVDERRIGVADETGITGDTMLPAMAGAMRSLLEVGPSPATVRKARE